ANFTTNGGASSTAWVDGFQALFDNTSPGGTIFLGTGGVAGNVAPAGTGTTNTTAGTIVDSANNFVFAGGSITSGSLFKGSAGSLTLNNTNTFTTVTVAGGSLVLNNTNTIGTLAVSAGTVTANASTTLTT